MAARAHLLRIWLREALGGEGDGAEARRAAERLAAHCSRRRLGGFMDVYGRVSAGLRRPFGPAARPAARAFMDGLLGPEELEWLGEPGRGELPLETSAALFAKLVGGPAPRAAGVGWALARECWRAVQENRQASVLCSWYSDRFVRLYAARCGVVAQHLDAAGLPARRYGGRRAALRLLREGGAAALARATPQQLCPDAAAEDRRQVELRSQQQVRPRTTDIYKCPVCGARECTYREVQTRALDEAATVFCSCAACGSAFRGS